MRVLLVEDEPAIRTAVSRGLTQAGHQVDSASSLMEARALAAKSAPEALLSDLKLPDGSGLDLAGELRVPFVLMSGYATFDDAVQAMRMGCVDFFTKPVAIKDLRRALDRLLHRTRSETLQAVDPGEGAGTTLRLANPAAAGLVVQDCQARAVRWSDPGEAQRRFAEAAEATSSPAERQIVAELMQSAATGRLVVNAATDWWVAWLEAGVDWQETEAERRQVIEDLGERCVWRGDGALVEVSRD